MSDSPPNSRDKAHIADQAAPPAGLDTLRDLIVGPTASRLDAVRATLDNPERHAAAVADVLPKAVTIGASKDNQLASALEPILEDSIRTSIKRDRRILVDALFPVMGPAIRKAIASTIQGLIQNFNQVLEHSLSLRGLRWRWEAMRTRRPFAEVVLLNTLVYQVEQVFFIHRESGLLIAHVVAKTAEAQNPDLVSGMLTAIRDFVQDSFGAEQEDTLDTFQVGDRKVWIEHGAYGMLAAVIRGNPPETLKEIMRDALDEIHLKQSAALAKFDGDCTEFEAVRPILGGVLQVQFKEQKRKKATRAWLVVALLVFLAGLFAVQTVVKHNRWHAFVNQLRGQPGLVLTQVDDHDGRYHIHGLKDPLAQDPRTLADADGIDAQAVVFHLEPYASSHPPFALQRAKTLLLPPATVHFTFDDGRLAANGAATAEWIRKARDTARLFPWLESYDDGQLLNLDSHLAVPETASLTLNGTTLHVRGHATHRWISTMRRDATAIDGIMHVDTEALVDLDVDEWQRLAKAISQATFYFEAGTTTLVEGQDAALAAFLASVKKMAALSDTLKRLFAIQVSGHADQTGDDTFNLSISRQRAQSFIDRLVAVGIPDSQLSLRAVGAAQPVSEGTSRRDRARNRRVEFRLTAVDE